MQGRVQKPLRMAPGLAERMVRSAAKRGQSEQSFMCAAVERAVEQCEAEERARKARREQNRKLRSLGVDSKKPPSPMGLGLCGPESESPPAPVEPIVVDIDAAEVAQVRIGADGGYEVRRHDAAASAAVAAPPARPSPPAGLGSLLRGAATIDLSLLR